MAIQPKSESDLFKSAPWWKPPGFSETNLGPEERRVFSVIRFHLGAARAIQVDEIASMIYLTMRAIRDILSA